MWTAKLVPYLVLNRAARQVATIRLGPHQASRGEVRRHSSLPPSPESCPLETVDNAAERPVPVATSYVEAKLHK